MFWERFLEECNRIGKKPNAIRDDLGISSGTLTKWKNGTVPSGKSLQNIASYFGVTTDYLLGESEDRQAKPMQLVIDRNKLDSAITLKPVLDTYFNNCDVESQLRIIQFAIDEYERKQTERKTSQVRAEA